MTIEERPYDEDVETDALPTGHDGPICKAAAAMAPVPPKSMKITSNTPLAHSCGRGAGGEGTTTQLLPNNRDNHQQRLIFRADIDHSDFLADALAGLASIPKTLPCKYFYDQRGSQLFDLICELPEYYPTRTETAIMEDNIADIRRSVGDDCVLVEYGSGSSTKTRILLDNHPRIAGYVPIDISRDHLIESCARLADRYPNLAILPVCADYTQEFALPQEAGSGPVTVYFPGSTIGNFHPEDALAFLRRIAALCGPGGGLLIGVDLKKDHRILNAAYNDSAGVTEQFNLNVLHRMNQELGATFEIACFDHHAFFNPQQGRIEMHLVSKRRQIAWLGDVPIAFAEGETIFTESSYKYGLDQFASLAAQAGFGVEQVWTDPARLFSVQMLRVSSTSSS